MTKSVRNKKKRDWRQTTFIVISVLIVLSMMLALALSFAPPPAP